MDLELWLSGAALVISLACLARAWVPPQQRTVFELQRLTLELRDHVEELGKRVLTRTKQENMARAREEHEQRAERRRSIEEHAAELIEQSRAQQQAPAAPADEKTALRRALHLGKLN